jgi:Putative binding domain, N-terminal
LKNRVEKGPYPNCGKFKHLQAIIAGCTYTISPASVVYSASGGAGSISVEVMGTACPWTATSNVDWITITEGSSGLGNGTVAYQVASNNTGSERTGTLTIAGETFTVTQNKCAFAIYPLSENFLSRGGTGSVSVTTDSACSWTAASNADWITVTAGSSGNGNGTVNYKVSANRTNKDRTGTITVADNTFTITQKKMASLPWLLLLLEE